MRLSDFPPGVNARDIPGNRPEDTVWDEFHVWLDKVVEANALTPEDLVTVVRDGLKIRTIRKARDLRRAAGK